MGGFNFGVNLFTPGGVRIDSKAIQDALARLNSAPTTGVPSARDFAPVVPGAGTAYVPPTPAPTLTGMAAATDFSPSSGPITDEARVAQAEADAQNRQFLRESGINVEGLSPAQYQAATQALGEWRNLPENRAYRDSSSAFGRFVDSIGGPAGLFGLTVGALTGGLGYAGMLGSAGAGAAAGAVTGAVSGDPLRAGLAGAAGGILGSGANAALGGPTQAAAATGTTTPAAQAAAAQAAPAAATTTATTTPAIQAAAAAPSAAAGGGSAINIAAGTGLASPAAGAINLGAAGLGAAAPAVSTAAPLTMGGLLGGVSPAAGSINLGAAGLGAAGGASMGGISGFLSGAGNFLNQAGNFIASPGGQLLSGLGQAGLGYLGQQEQMDMAQQLAEQARFRPYNIQGPLGAVDITGQDISISPTAQQQQLQQGLFGAAQQQLGIAGAPALAGIVSRAPGQVESLAQQFIRQQTTTPEAARVLAQQLGGLGQQATQFGAQGIQQAFRAPSAQAAATQALRSLQGQAEAARLGSMAGNLGATGQRALGQAFRAPDALSAISGQLGAGGYQGLPSSVGMASQFLRQQPEAGMVSSQGAVSRFLGQTPQAGMISARGAVGGLLGGAAPGVAGMGAGALRGALGPSREEGLVSQAAGAGLGLLAEGAAGARGLAGEIAGAGGELLRGAQAPSFNQLAAERLAALRGQARTGEERATQSAIERLFSQGRLGTTGGQRALGELARAQEEADISRAVAAQDFAQQQQNIAAQQALQQQQLGAGLLGTGLAGQQFLAQQGQGLLGMGAQVGQFGRTLGADIGQFGVGLGEQARQADIGNILAATGQDVSQLQFGATLGEQQRAQNLQSLLAAQAQDIGQRQFGAELSEQQRAQNLQALLAAQAQDIGQQQFGTSFAEQQRQANIEALLAATGQQQAQAQFLGGLGERLTGQQLGAQQFLTQQAQAQRQADIATQLQAAEADQLRAARLGQLGQGLFGLGAEIPATVFEAQRLADQASLSRGAQRVAAAEGLFGFGQQAQQQALQQATMAAGAQADLYSPLIQLANIASGMGGAQATAAARGVGLQYDAFGSPYTAAGSFFGGLLG